MPFKSQAQRRMMFAKHPGIAKRWAEHTPDMKGLPEKVGKGKRKKKGGTSRLAAIWQAHKKANK